MVAIGSAAHDGVGNSELLKIDMENFLGIVNFQAEPFCSNCVSLSGSSSIPQAARCSGRVGMPAILLPCIWQVETRKSEINELKS